MARARGVHEVAVEMMVAAGAQVEDEIGKFTQTFAPTGRLAKFRIYPANQAAVGL
jgi:hypothetical protein